MLDQFKHVEASTEIVQAPLLALAPVDATLGAKLENPNIAPNTAQEPPQATPDTTTFVARLLAIRERLFKLAAVCAVTTSWDIAIEADRWREKFHK
jgi:hypothetical protein